MVDALAERIRQTWIAEYRQRAAVKLGRPSRYNPSPRWDGGCDTMGRSYKPFWPKAAAFLRRHKIENVAYYVRAQFDATPGQAPFPNVLISGAGLNRYRRATDLSAEELTLALVLQTREYRLKLLSCQRLYGGNRPLVINYVLQDETASLSALFRYYAAVRDGLFSTARHWEAAAREQFRRSEDSYREVWGEFPLIPDEVSHDSLDS